LKKKCGERSDSLDAVLYNSQVWGVGRKENGRESQQKQSLRAGPKKKKTAELFTSLSKSNGVGEEKRGVTTFVSLMILEGAKIKKKVDVGESAYERLKLIIPAQGGSHDKGQRDRFTGHGINRAKGRTNRLKMGISRPDLESVR